MLKTILRKTVYEKRVSTLLWGIALALLIAFTVVLFPTLRDSFGASLKDVPESLRSLLGNASDYQTIAGYVDVQIFNQYTFMTIAFGIIVATGLLAGDEGDGTLQQLLTLPVTRSRVYLEKLLALIVLIGILMVFIGLGILAGCAIVGESLHIGRLVLALMDLWLITLVFGIIGYAIGAVTGKRGLAGAVAGMAAFVFYLITTLANSVHSLKVVNNFSPFHYYNNPSVLRQGLQGGDMAVLLMICVVLGYIGYLVFKRRDIYQA
jgi:ABC-2 type transport system permease protein